MDFLKGIGALLLTLAAFSVFSLKFPKGDKAMGVWLTQLWQHSLWKRFLSISAVTLPELHSWEKSVLLLVAWAQWRPLHWLAWVWA